MDFKITITLTMLFMFTSILGLKSSRRKMSMAVWVIVTRKDIYQRSEHPWFTNGRKYGQTFTERVEELKRENDLLNEEYERSRDGF
jgi:hypothetical protein